MSLTCLGFTSYVRLVSPRDLPASPFPVLRLHEDVTMSGLLQILSEHQIQVCMLARKSLYLLFPHPKRFVSRALHSTCVFKVTGGRPHSSLTWSRAG